MWKKIKNKRRQIIFIFGKCEEAERVGKSVKQMIISATSVDDDDLGTFSR